ncbi:BTAD domain-containing putative transcriptional regulator [Blastococcus sp. SYSU D00695]
MTGRRGPRERPTAPGGLVVQLLGPPRLELPGGAAYRFRSRKSWATLAYLLLADRPPPRARLAELLFAGADDPLGALRWSLAEIRRGLGPGGCVAGDPVVVDPGPGATVDAVVVTAGAWQDAVGLPGLGGELLEGVDVRAAPAFDAWLLAERQRLTAASESVLHEAALASASAGRLDVALAHARRAADLAPLDEEHQALVVRLYRQAGQDAAAERSAAAFARALRAELGVAPGPALAAALARPRADRDAGAGAPRAPDDEAIGAVVEAGAAAVAAGAVDAGLASLRTGVRLADRSGSPPGRTRARLVLAEALVHTLRGLDDEGLGLLHEAERIAAAAGDGSAAAAARAELGYVDFLRARYSRATRWLTRALEAGPAPAVAAMATTYLGAVESDRGDYPRAARLLTAAQRLSREAGDPRREAYALAMRGRVDLLRGDLGSAASRLAAAADLAASAGWLSFLPWPQALLGEVHLTAGEPARAARVLQPAFARACELGDPCWEGLAARGLALVAEAAGDPGRAFAVLADARARGTRYADSYAWLDVHVLDALCTLGRRHAHPDTGRWVTAMRTRASRTGMRDLAVRALLHGAALGRPGDAAAAALLAEEVDSPRLHALAEAVRPTASAPAG